MRYIKLFEQFINESAEEKEAEAILQDLLDERDADEILNMTEEDAEDTVLSYGHKGIKAGKIAKILYNLASTGTFESKKVNESAEEQEAHDILADLVGEWPEDELVAMSQEDAEDTVKSYGHKGSKAKKIAKILYNLTSTGTFESKKVNEASGEINSFLIKFKGNQEELTAKDLADVKSDLGDDCNIQELIDQALEDMGYGQEDYERYRILSTNQGKVKPKEEISILNQLARQLGVEELKFR